MTVLVIAEHDHASVKGATLHTVTAAVACGEDAPPCTHNSPISAVTTRIALFLPCTW